MMSSPSASLLYHQTDCYAELVVLLLACCYYSSMVAACWVLGIAWHTHGVSEKKAPTLVEWTERFRVIGVIGTVHLIQARSR